MLEARSKYADVEASEPLVDPQCSMSDSNDEGEGLTSSLLSEKKQSRRGSRTWAGYTGLWGFSSAMQRLLRLVLPCAISLLALLVPSFVTSLTRGVCNARRRFPGGIRTAAAATTERPLSPTAYLDGVRGVAALIVYVFHWGYLWFPFLRQGWHSSSGGAADADPGTDLFLQRPVVRALHSGRASVTVFFVVSGYVIAVKTLTLIHRGQLDRALDSLAGSLFRRPFRLYLPIVVATLINLVLVRCDGVFQKDPTGSGGPPRGATLGRQLWHWWKHTVHMINPFRNIDGRANLYSPPYNGHLWTIPIEFKGSLLVFLLLLAFMKAKRWLHMSVTFGFVCWLAQLGDLDMALFCAGLLLAELSIVLPPGGKSGQTENGVITTTNSRPGRSLRVVRHVATLSLLFLALHLLSYPENSGYKSPGFRTLSVSVPAFYKDHEEQTQWFWISIGSVLFILALMYSPSLPLRCNGNKTGSVDIPRLSTLPVTVPEASGVVQGSSDPGKQPLLQRPFTTAFAQYLGRISYALYLAHGTVMHTVGTRFLNPAWAAWLGAEEAALDLRKTGLDDVADTVLQRSWSTYMGSALWGTLINTFVLFWVADVFCRSVDVPMVKLTRALANWAWKK
ncbi:hypothetical protein PG996_001208 [Apiospora saccharicola]|uniref:Acyltransferase 3 domain-containing protein n=1 Tax=Apiospora saccharicola TaxID=335842 RepID=A0ABR1WFY5_9PEZI